MPDDHHDVDEASIQASLLKAAMALVNDRAKARTLVALTLESARRDKAREAGPTRAELFRALRQTCHSIERSPARRRLRDSLVSALAEGQRRSRADRTH